MIGPEEPWGVFKKKGADAAEASRHAAALEIAHCQNIADACRTFIDRAVIRYCFGAGVKPLAHFGLPDMDTEDAQQLRESAGFLTDRGAKVEMSTVAERLGVTLTEDDDDALQPISKAPLAGAASDAADGETPPRTANAKKLNLLRELVEEALRTQNFDPNEPRDEDGE